MQVRSALTLAVQFVLRAQYPNGGFAQSYPLRGSYNDAVTLNDNVMTDLLNLLWDIAHRPEYQWLSADLRAKAQPLINAIIANSPQAVVAAKALVAYVADAPLTPDTIAETSRRIAAIRVSSEGQEGLTAFLDKRTPAWQQTTSAGQTEE